MFFLLDIWHLKIVLKMKLTVISVSGGFLKTKHCQNHEQDAWPEEFGEGEDLGKHKRQNAESVSRHCNSPSA